MPTFGEQFYVEERSVLKRLGRDFRLAKFLFSVLVMWATKGRKVRAAYRAARADGRPLHIDFLDPRRGRP